MKKLMDGKQHQLSKNSTFVWEKNVHRSSKKQKMDVVDVNT